jgi:hypothetical protein
MLRMAAGGARAQAEAGRMVLEKVLAAGEAQAAATVRPCGVTRDTSSPAKPSTFMESGCEPTDAGFRDELNDDYI